MRLLGRFILVKKAPARITHRAETPVIWDTQSMSYLILLWLKLLIFCSGREMILAGWWMNLEVFFLPPREARVMPS